MADTPFGLSFGNPSRYMGQSPLAEIGKAAKTGLMAYAVQQSGLEKYLNDQGISKNKQGTYGFNPPAGSAVPTGAAMAPVAPSPAGGLAMPSGAVAPNSVAPATPAPLTPPPNIGGDILDGKFEGVETSFVDPQAQRDTLVLPQQTGYNQILATGNEYQQMPGYGKLAKAFQAFGGGMMG